MATGTSFSVFPHWKRTSSRGGILDGGYACYGIYETKDGKFITVGCLEEAFWSNICDALGLDPHFVEWQFDETKQEEVRAKLGEIFRIRNMSEWLEFFEDIDVPVGPLNSLVDALNDPQLTHRNMLVRIPDRTLGVLTQVGNPIKMSAIEDGEEIRSSPPTLGQDTDNILESLGYSLDKIAEFHREGIV